MKKKTKILAGSTGKETEVECEEEIAQNSTELLSIEEEESRHRKTPQPIEESTTPDA